MHVARVTNGTARWLAVLALIGAAVFLVLPAGATTPKRLTWRYHVVLDAGHSTLDWKVTSGDGAGSKGTSLNQYTEHKGKGFAVMFVYPGTGKPRSGGGGSNSSLNTADTYTTTTCLDGQCEATCTAKVDKYLGSGSTDWKIVQKGKAVRVAWHVPFAVPSCYDDLFTGVSGTKPTTVPLARFERHKLTLRSHGVETYSQNGAVGTMHWDWRMKLVRKPTR
jgi:hypothetical protein